MVLTQREAHGAAFRPPLSKGSPRPSVPVLGLNFPHLITFWKRRRGKERGGYRLHADPGRHGLSFDNGLLQGRLDWF